jgi:HDOD domain
MSKATKQTKRTTARRSSGSDRPKDADRRGGVGGRRLAEAFETVTAMPALAEARRRLVSLCDQQAPSPGEVSEAIEADTALAIAIMRAANNGEGPSGRTGGVREAVEYLQADGVSALAGGLETYDVLEQPGSSSRYERFRRHGVAVRIGLGAAARRGEAGAGGAVRIRAGLPGTR